MKTPVKITYLTKKPLANSQKSEGLPSEKTFIFFTNPFFSLKNRDSSFYCQISTVFLSQENRFYFYRGILVEFDRCLLKGSFPKLKLLGEFIL